MWVGELVGCWLLVVCLSLFMMFDPVVGGSWGVLWELMVYLCGGWLVGLVVLGVAGVFGGRSGVLLGALVKVYYSIHRLGVNYVGFLHFLVSICLFLLLVNLSSLTPGVVGWTSHLMCPCGLALISWLSCILVRFFKDWRGSLAGMLPEGTPDYLCFFMVWIESISVLARPVTLSGRLLCNMVASKIFVFLVALSVLCVWWSTCLSLISVCIFMAFAVVIIFFLWAELCVCFLQSYVFGLLVSSYCEGE